MARPVHFEIHASDPDGLIAFYQDLFGWSFHKWDGGDYWLITTGPEDKPGINGGLLPRRGDVPGTSTAVNAFVITVDVSDIDTMLARIGGMDTGASVAVPKMAVPGIGWLAYAKDPDGNLFGMMQADLNAK
jgi:predicted enzyme related to lactoylglutathione lyase